MEAIRCGGCHAMMFKANTAALNGRIEIKCRRCGVMNIIRPIAEAHNQSATQRPKEDENGRE